MAFSQDFLDYVLDQLQALEGITSRRMFGGAGLYCNGLFFAIVDDGLFFKVDATNRGDYEARGSRAFTVAMGHDGSRSVAMSYYAVPGDVLEDADELRQWARKAIAAAVTSAANAKSKPRRKKGEGIAAVKSGRVKPP